METKECIFCNIKSEREIISENDFAIAFYDAYPVTKYHTLIIPKRHISDYFELTKEELEAIEELLKKQKEEILKLDNSVTGFNIGVNIGADAGQSIFHSHTHLIPRRKGDTENPRGGVRGVIKEKQSY